MKNSVRHLCLWLCTVAAFAGAAHADLENENLLVSVPPGYKIDFQKKQPNSTITEMVPTDETVHNWTEMVTVQVFYNLKNLAPQQFKTRMEQLWGGACPGSQSKPLGQAMERGYSTLMWVLLCPLNSSTGKPENTWFKAIQGRDSFYVVQKAYKFTPSTEQEMHWLGYLMNVTVCDTRVPESACPKLSPQRAACDDEPA
jgi:hypothetical protein